MYCGQRLCIIQIKRKPAVQWLVNLTSTVSDILHWIFSMILMKI
eukprot:UN21570